MILISTTVKLPDGKEVTANLKRLGQAFAPLRYCWFYDGIYRAGSSTRSEAEEWAKDEGLIVD